MLFPQHNNFEREKKKERKKKRKKGAKPIWTITWGKRQHIILKYNRKREIEKRERLRSKRGERKRDACYITHHITQG